jgi:AcrR family transcriptional regulator
MGKGDGTRQAVLDRAVELTRRVGLGGLTIGTLADQVRLSKSGLFAHFRSKEALQIAVLEHVRAGFEADVAQPALRAARGEARVRELFRRWLEWESRPGGCPYVAAATEFDDQPGPVRDRLVRDLRDNHDMIARVCQTGIAEGQFRPDADPDQFAQDLYGIILAYHQTSRLLGDKRAAIWAQHAFEALLANARTAPSS